MRRVWLILAFFVLIIGLFFYVYLGGFNEPEISIRQRENITIVGFPYEGQMNVKAFGLNFQHADSLVENGIINGSVAGYFYNQPVKGGDFIKAFIGVIPNDTNSIPTAIEKRTYPSGKIIEAVIEGHYLIMPVNIYPRIREFAEEKKLKISEESVEIYETKRRLVVQVEVLN